MDPAVLPEIKNLQELLKLDDNEEVLRTISTYLTAPGENYGSVMANLRIETSKSRHLNLVAKLPPASEELWVAFDIPVSFKKEANMYAKIIPLLLDFQRENGIPDERLLSAFPTYYNHRLNLAGDENAAVDQDGVLLLENLKVQGYELLDRLLGLDQVNCYRVMGIMARMHATVIAVKIQDHTRFQEVILPNLHTNRTIDFTEYLKPIVDCVQKHAPFTEQLMADVMEKLNVGIVQFNEKTVSGADIFRTLVHNDFWINNVLINTATGDVRILDFQMMLHGSCVQDVLFFLLTSGEYSVIIAQFHSIVKKYYEIFIDTLQEFKCDISVYSFDKFMDEIKLFTPYLLIHALLMARVVSGEKGKQVDFTNPEDSEAYIKKLVEIVSICIATKII